MVDRCSKIAAECVVVDLDGTLLRGNSLREMIRAMLREGIREHDYLTVSKIVSLLIMRKAGLINHQRMKHPIHRIAQKWMSKGDRIQRLVDILLSLVNDSVKKLIDNLHQQGTKVVIATAAPELYLPEFISRMGYDEYIATPLTDKLIDYTENRGETKRANVEALAARNGWRITHVITDHIDDLPLLMLPVQGRTLISPSKELCETMRNLNLAFNVK